MCENVCERAETARLCVFRPLNGCVCTLHRESMDGVLSGKNGSVLHLPLFEPGPRPGRPLAWTSTPGRSAPLTALNRSSRSGGRDQQATGRVASCRTRNTKVVGVKFVRTDWL